MINILNADHDIKKFLDINLCKKMRVLAAEKITEKNAKKIKIHYKGNKPQTHETKQSPIISVNESMVDKVIGRGI